MSARMLQNQQPTESNQNIFQCELKDVRILINMLKTIDLKENVIIMFDVEGILFTSEKNNVFQITGYLERKLFEKFKLSVESICVKVHIKLLMDCLTSMLENLGAQDELTTSIEIVYAGHGEPLHLVLRDEVSITKCRLSLQDSENIISFRLENESIISRVIVNSNYLKETLKQILNGENLQISVDPNFGLMLSTTGDGVTSTHYINKDSKKLVIYKFRKVHSNAYKIKFIKFCTKALDQSEQTCIMIDGNGLLKIEFNVRTVGDRTCYVQAFCLPNVDSSI